MIIDGVLGSEAIDSSGEVLDVKGADISDVEKGTCLLNWEHTPGEKGASTLVGVVLAAKKIYKRDDCENERQRMYWDEIKLPYIYGICRLYDGAGHEEAKRIAAIIRDHAANKEPIVCRYSVEGATLKKEDNHLLESVVRRVAVTVKPCNRTAVSGLIEDPNAPAGFEKKHTKEKTRDLLDFDDAAKSESDPMFQRLGKASAIVCNPIIEDNLNKATEAGVASAAPSALTGGAALQREDLGPTKPHKKRWSVHEIMKALTAGGYTGETFNRTEFRGFAKTLMPDVSDDFIDHFTDVVEDYHVKRKQLAKKEASTAAPKPTPVQAVKPAAETPAPKAAAPKPAKSMSLDDNPIKLSVATIRGVPVTPQNTSKFTFDEEKGILHTRKGSFPLYNPDVGFQVKEHKAAKKSPFYHNGVLHVAPGTNMASVPHNGPNPEFRKLLTSPEAEEFHTNRVMPNWLELHDHNKAGTLPEEVTMYASAFSMMSPNTPVSMQELMSGHLHDTFEDSGIDMRDPAFGKQRSNFMRRNKKDRYPTLGDFQNNPDVHLSNASAEKGRKAGELKSFMLASNKFDNVARYHKLHPTMVDLIKRHGVDARSATAELMGHKLKELQWKNKRHAFKTRLMKDAAGQGLTDAHKSYVEGKMAEADAAGKFKRKGAPPVEREPGADDDDESPLPFDPRLLAGGDDFDPDNFDQQQAEQHPSLARGSISRLTGRKWYRAKFKQEATDQGLKNELSDYVRGSVNGKFPKYDGVAVPGLAPKTGRYAFLMTGGGNSVVPDTHFVRHLFGMDNATDGKTLQYLKTGLWRAGNHAVLEGIDRWYAKNHPAAKVMQEHPTLGQHFKDDPEQSVGPAFWRHWGSIYNDEKNRGLDVSASQNAATVHKIYWDIMDRVFGRKDRGGKMAMKKFEGDAPDEHMIGKMLALHHQYELDCGEIPAQMMYMHHIVPHLLEAAKYRQAHDDHADFIKSLTRVDTLGIELRKSAQEIQSAKLADPKVPTVHGVYFSVNGQEHRAGRFMLHDGNVHHLEDYYDLLKDKLPEGPLGLQGISTVHSWKMTPHLRVSVEAMQNDQPKLREHAHPEKMQNNARLPRPPSVFEYQRAGMDKPHTLEVRGEHYLLDGEKLSPPEVQTILANHASGAATIRYKSRDKQQFDSIKKAEEAFMELSKAFSEDDVLAHHRAAEAAGHAPKGSSEDLARMLYEDPMVPGIGNKKAATNFLAKQKPGVYLSMDGNDFSKINNQFGHAAGDSAIQAFGQAARAASDEATPGVGKLFRNGGDEFVAHFPSHEHAAQFSRALSEKLDAMAPIGGQHKLSMSFGFGADSNTADKALYEAKKQKIDPAGNRVHPIGQVPNLMHSLVPGHEGPLPVHDPGAHAVQETLAPPKVAVEKPVKLPAAPTAAA